MAADDDNQPAPDPWANLMGEDLADQSADNAFDFSADTLGEVAGASPGPGSEIVAAEADSASAEEPADADVDAWLSGAGDPASEAVPPLSVFVPEEHVADQGSASTIEIGTGLSGIGVESGAPTDQLDAADAVDVEALWGESEEAIEVDEHTQEFVSVAPDANPEAPAAEVFGEMSDDLPAGEPAADSEAFAGIADEPAAAGFDLDNALPIAAAAGAATLAVGGKSTSKSPARPGRKQGGIGQIIGVVAGGLMAIPIVLGILIGYMWMGGPDTMGIGKSMPTALRFLLPPKSTAAKQTAVATAAGSPNLGSAPSLDDLAAGAGPLADAVAAKDGAAAEPRTDAFAAATADVPTAPPGDAASSDTPKPEMLDAPKTDAPSPDAPPAPAPAPADVAAADPLVPAIPVFDGLAALNAPAAPPAVSPAPAAADPVPAAPPEPPPLDTANLEASVDDAGAAFMAVSSALEPTVFERKVLLVDWYKSLAKVAEELVTLENQAAESGRPLDAVPQPVAEMHERIAADRGLATELGRLGRQWLAFTKRRSDGVVLAVTFDSARRVGPYWSSKVSLEEFEGGEREMSVISRTEPKASRGDRLVVTGVVFDDGVIWAADCRPVEAAPAVGPDF